MDLATARRAGTRERRRAAAAARIATAEDVFAATTASIFRGIFAPVLDRMGTAVTAAGAEGFVSVDDLASIRAEWAAAAEARLVPLIASMFDEASGSVLSEFATAVAGRRGAEQLEALEAVLDRHAAEYLAKAESRLVGIGDTAWASARAQLVEGFRAGESIEDLAGRVQGALDAGEARAVTIARTEVIGASNAGAMAGARALGDFGPTHKQWMATLDPRTRETHADADGQVVPIGDPFDVGGAELDYPGDPAGPVEEVVNCRCTVIYVDDPDATIDSAGRQTGTPEDPPTDDLAAAGVVDHQEDTTMARRRASATFTRDGQTITVPSPPARSTAAADDVVPPDPGPPISTPPPPAPDAAPAEGDALAPLVIEVPDGVIVRAFEAIASVEGRWTGDDRYWLPGSYRWEGMLPQSFTFDHEDTVSSVAGLVGEYRRIPGPNPGENLIVARGFIDCGTADRPNEEGLAAVHAIETGTCNSVSIRFDDETLGGIDPATLSPGEDEWWMMVVEDCRLRALSLVPVAAFPECRITLDPAGIDVTNLPPAPTGPDAVTRAEADAMQEAIEEQIEDLFDELDDFPIMLAAAGAPGPPADAFADPQFDRLTPLTVSEPDANGWRRVAGHIAGWGTCHTGFPGQCVTAPRSSSGYAYFHTGEVQCDDGSRVAVGRITAGTGHAPTRGVSARGAAAHYDNTGWASGYVRAGEDAHGIWHAGVIAPNCDDEQLATAMASPPSGDWRRIAGALELVATLHVNSGGFPVPRARTAAGAPQALVAAGLVTTTGPTSAVDRVAERIARTIGRDVGSRAAALAARVHGPQG